MSNYQEKQIGGRWGALMIEYRNYEIKSYACRICGFRDGYYKNVQSHLSNDHEMREKLSALADELEYDDDSRIDRFKKVMETMDKIDWAEKLIEARKETPPSEVNGESHPGLNTALTQ